SAGSQPKGVPHPMALKVLSENSFDVSAFRSKSWDEFSTGTPNAPHLDTVITVCDSAAAETCPLWTGTPVRAHWGLPDPAAVTEPETAVREAFETTFQRLKARAAAMAALPIATMDASALQQALNDIGLTDDAPGAAA
ncbi:MAG: arsenate reductase ArsC, partial [Pseudomonadota bacterium]